MRGLNPPLGKVCAAGKTPFPLRGGPRCKQGVGRGGRPDGKSAGEDSPLGDGSQGALEGLTTLPSL